MIRVTYIDGAVEEHPTATRWALVRGVDRSGNPSFTPDLELQARNAEDNGYEAVAIIGAGTFRSIVVVGDHYAPTYVPAPASDAGP